MEENRKPRPWLKWIVIGLASPLIYMLSVGPVAGLQNRGYLSDPVAEWAGWIYAPAIVVYDELITNPTVPLSIRKNVEWYVFIW